MESSQIATRRAASLPILLCHGRGNNDVDTQKFSTYYWLTCSKFCALAADEVVTYRNGERSAEILRSSGFAYLSFKPYNGYSSANTTPENSKLPPSAEIHYLISYDAGWATIPSLKKWIISGSDSTQHLAATDLAKRRVFAYTQWLW